MTIVNNKFHKINEFVTKKKKKFLRHKDHPRMPQNSMNQVEITRPPKEGNEEGRRPDRATKR